MGKRIAEVDGDGGELQRGWEIQESGGDLADRPGGTGAVPVNGSGLRGGRKRGHAGGAKNGEREHEPGVLRTRKLKEGGWGEGKSRKSWIRY